MLLQTKDRRGCCDDAHTRKNAVAGKINFKSLLRIHFGHLRSEIGTFENSFAENYITTNIPLGGPGLGPMANTSHTRTPCQAAINTGFFYLTFLCDLCV